jgi:hypothetical protein
MLSVPTQYGGRGLGKALVAAVEQALTERCPFAAEVQMTIDVVATCQAHERTAIAWYVALGYESLGDPVPAWWAFSIEEALLGKVLVQPMQKSLKIS